MLLWIFLPKSFSEHKHLYLLNTQERNRWSQRRCVCVALVVTMTCFPKEIDWFTLLLETLITLFCSWNAFSKLSEPYPLSCLGCWRWAEPSGQGPRAHFSPSEYFLTFQSFLSTYRTHGVDQMPWRTLGLAPMRMFWVPMVIVSPGRPAWWPDPLVANAVFLFLESPKKGLPTWRWPADFRWLWLMIDIGWLQSSGIFLLILGFELHIWAHAPCTLAHSYSHHSASLSNLPYPREVWWGWGRAAGKLYPMQPNCWDPKKQSTPSTGSTSHPLWMAVHQSHLL